MPYVPVPKDLTKVKTKVIFNLTKRQLVCFGAGVLVGVPAYLLTRKAIGNEAAVFLMMGLALPFFVFGIYEKDGQPLEKKLAHFIRARFLWPRTRPYQTENFYAALERQNQKQKEAQKIGQLLMEQVSRAVDDTYRDHLDDLAYDTEGSLLEELDALNLEVRYKALLTASVQYTLLTRCGLDPAKYLEDEDLRGITEFSTPAVLHHLGDASSAVSIDDMGKPVTSFHAVDGFVPATGKFITEDEIDRLLAGGPQVSETMPCSECQRKAPSSTAATPGWTKPPPVMGWQSVRRNWKRCFMKSSTSRRRLF